MQHLLRFPITATIIAINVIIFGINHLQVLGAPYFSRPGVLDHNLFLSNFSHTSLSHILMNMYLLYMIGPFIESKLSPTAYIFVILAIWIILSLLGYVFNPSPSLGFSGIGLGLMAFVALFYAGHGGISQQLVTWIGINIAIGFLPGISLAGHLLGAVSGGLVFFLMKVLRFF